MGIPEDRLDSLLPRTPDKSVMGSESGGSDTSLQTLHLSPPPFVKGGDSLALSLRQGYYEGEIGQVFIKLKNLWTPETTFVNPSVSCHIDNRS